MRVLSVQSPVSLSGSFESYRKLIPYPAVGGSFDFFMVEVINNSWMPLLYPLVGRFVIHEAAAMFPGHFLRLLFKRFKITAIPLTVDFLI